MSKKVFAFDLGKASMGICARDGHEITDLKSLILNHEYANIAEYRDRRRVFKTKHAHKVREDYFNKIWTNTGLEVLSKDDNRLKKEFPSKNENIIYSSTLLRIALLQNKPLEQWQIYKALHNSIQRRGYDAMLPWLSSGKYEKAKDEEENAKFLQDYINLRNELVPDENYHYPCYVDATLLGLWNYQNPNEFKLRIDHNAKSARDKNRVAPREMVEKELTELFDNAKKQLPQLQSIDTQEFLYGEGKCAYASYECEEFKKHMGRDWDRQGVLSQKIPRFENRILAKCQLMPKRNVCKANTLENIFFVLLMQLKNFRYRTPDGYSHPLTSEQINQIFDNKKQDWIKTYNDKDKKSKKYNITKTPIEKTTGITILKDEFKEIKANTSGRANFCKPVLKMTTEIILSGKAPSEFEYTDYIQNCDENSPEKGITKSEIEKMLARLGESWDKIHIGDNRDELAQGVENKEQQIAKIIGSTTNPVVRHRMQWFYNELKKLEENNGTPDEVIIEFIRGDKNETLAQKFIYKQNLNEKENEKILKELEEANLPKSAFLKLKLLREQQGKCAYTGENIAISQLPYCQIDHIVPVSQGGCDALYNKVLCTAQANQDKGNKTPYEWLHHDDDKWYAYVQRIGAMNKSLKGRKADLLRDKNPLELIENKNGLQETAQIARMAQQITSIHFGWGMQTKDDKRRVFVSNGSQTSEFRRVYKLNRLLGDDTKKNRSNNKHHALDAIAISYSRDIKGIKKPNGDYYRGVEGFEREYIARAMENLMPHTIKPNTSKQKVKETVYGKKQRDGKFYLTTRKELIGVENKERAIKKIWDLDIQNDLLEKLSEYKDKNDWIKMLESYTHPKKQSIVKKVQIIETETDKIEYDGNGRERFGKYCDFGNKGTKGQFRAADQHKGQIIYFDEKDIPRVMPIYTNQKEAEVKSILKNKGYKLYKNGMFFYSSVQLFIPEEFKGTGASIHQKGIYELKTMKADGRAILQNANGNEIPSTIKNLINAHFELYKEEKHSSLLQTT